MNAQEKALVRNETIDEMCDWLDSCIAQVDPESDVFKACTAMVNALRNKKVNVQQDTRYPDETHYPLTSHNNRV